MPNNPFSLPKILRNNSEGSNSGNQIPQSGGKIPYYKIVGSNLPPNTPLKHYKMIVWGDGTRYATTDAGVLALANMSAAAILVGDFVGEVYDDHTAIEAPLEQRVQYKLDHNLSLDSQEERDCADALKAKQQEEEAAKAQAEADARYLENFLNFMVDANCFGVKTELSQTYRSLFAKNMTRAEILRALPDADKLAELHKELLDGNINAVQAQNASDPAVFGTGKFLDVTRDDFAASYLKRFFEDSKLQPAFFDMLCRDFGFSSPDGKTVEANCASYLGRLDEIKKQLRESQQKFEKMEEAKKKLEERLQDVEQELVEKKNEINDKNADLVNKQNLIDRLQQDIWNLKHPTP